MPPLDMTALFQEPLNPYAGNQRQRRQQPAQQSSPLAYRLGGGQYVDTPTNTELERAGILQEQNARAAAQSDFRGRFNEMQDMLGRGGLDAWNWNQGPRAYIHPQIAAEHAMRALMDRDAGDFQRQQLEQRGRLQEADIDIRRAAEERQRAGQEFATGPEGRRQRFIEMAAGMPGASPQGVMEQARQAGLRGLFEGTGIDLPPTAWQNAGSTLPPSQMPEPPAAEDPQQAALQRNIEAGLLPPYAGIERQLAAARQGEGQDIGEYVVALNRANPGLVTRENWPAIATYLQQQFPNANLDEIGRGWFTNTGPSAEGVSMIRNIQGSPPQESFLGQFGRQFVRGLQEIPAATGRVPGNIWRNLGFGG